MDINSPLNSPRLQRPKLVVCMLIVSVVVVTSLGVRAYLEQREQARASERMAALETELYLIVETYGYIHQLGDGRAMDARQKLNLALQDRIESLDIARVSTDEPTRAWAKHILALIESDQIRHPAYYAVPRAVTQPAPVAESSKPAHPRP